MKEYTSEEIKNRLSNIVELEKENQQLKQKFEKLKEEKQYETCPYRSTDMGCDYCDWINDNVIAFENVEGKNLPIGK